METKGLIRERAKVKGHVDREPKPDAGAAIQTLFAELAMRKHEPRLKTVDGVYQLEVEGFGAWYVAVRGGSISVSRSPVAADCAIVFSPEDFIDILRGDQNLMTAFLQGRLSGWGDLGMALAFRRLLPLSS